MKTHVPPVYVRLPDYQYFDSPYSKDPQRNVDEKYMERREIEAQLRARIRDESNSRSGAILVTGYRGCGKTSLVRKVIKDLNRRTGLWSKAKGFLGLGPGTIHEAEINIAQDDIDERAILRLIAIELRRVLRRVRIMPFDLFGLGIRLLRFTLCLAIAALFVPWAVKQLHLPDPDNHWYGVFERGVLSTILQVQHDPLEHQEVLIPKPDTLVVERALANEIATDPDTTKWKLDVAAATPTAPPVVVNVNASREPGFSWLGLAESIALPIVIAVLAFLGLTWLYKRLLPEYQERSISQLRRRLDILIARMQSEVTTEETGGVGQGLAQGLVSYGLKRSTHYPYARTKEVEQEIVDVLRVFGDMAKPNQIVKFFFGRFKFVQNWDRRRIVFIIDELDKLIPHATAGLKEKDEEDPTDVLPSDERRHGTKGYENEWLRKRQEAIASLFANLKHFLNVAQAKFIFLGGRDLYDAVLADTSNRDAYFSSVFSQVFYVPSFLKEAQYDENGPIEGLTTTIERFVAEALLKKKDMVKRHAHHLVSLRDFLQHALPDEQRLREVTYAHDRDNRPPPHRKHLHQEQFEKVGQTYADRPRTRLTDEQVLHVYTALQNMSVYLTFRSHGIAKNLVRLFERFIVRLDVEEVDRIARDGGSVICGIGAECPAGLYLKLDQHQQYAHYFLTYLYRPFLSLNSGFYRALNDKQQVALTYLLDHIVKYHGIAFSFLHLESAPETIAVNKVPDFRKFLVQVLNRLGIHHIRTVDNGLFGFHFFNKIYHEIAYLSKVSELDAAAMNFTLDESLPVKQYFYKRLYHLIRLDKEKGHVRGGHVLSPTADMHSWIGELHFYDTEHEEALGQFRAAAAYYAPTSVSVRTAYRPGPAPYGSVPISATKLMPPEHFMEYVKLTLRQIHCLKKMKAMDDALILSNTLSRLIIEQISEAKAHDCMDVYDWRLLALAISVRLAIVEKHARKGLVYEDFEDLRYFLFIAQRQSLQPGAKGSNTVRLLATMNMYVGAILHYSNREVKVPLRTVDPYENDHFAISQSCYKGALARLLGIPVMALRPNYVLALVQNLESESRSELLLVANALSKYADSLIAHDSKGAARTFTGTRVVPKVTHVYADHQTGRMAAFLMLSCEAFVGCGQAFQAVFQIKKLIYLYMERVTSGWRPSPAMVKEIELLKDWAWSTIHGSNQHIDRQQLAKFIAQAKEPGLERLAHLAKRHDVVSYQSELLELDIIYHELLMRVDGPCARWRVRAFLRKHELQVSMQFTRARHLMLCLRHNWWSLEGAFRRQIDSKSPPTLDLSVVENADRLRTLVTDSLHCCFQIIGIMDLMGPSYMTNHSLIALANEHMGGWCLIHWNMRHSSSSDWRDMATAIRKELARLLDAKVESRLDPLMYFGIAKDHCQRAMSVHSRGRGYTTFMGDMFFLEDDYMDNLYHFTCALERMRLRMSVTHGANVYQQQMNNLQARIDGLEAWIAQNEPDLVSV